MTNIKIFWHVNELSGWNHVMDQQWNLINSSGLRNAVSEIHVCMNGQPWTFVNWLQSKNTDDSQGKIKLVNVNKDAAYHEWPTLMYMLQQAREAKEPYHICYIHLIPESY